ncbi:craniofacial development protein 2-like [Plakobranchus ocellatus]|uniref:Craniofacial development protein 2-like n=1 Tax=Plakobranchus ocellatus TaxID=259542 RepID=A0AAV3ZPD2_9GAST|nr:craniofacial development protein 2-like [Plakobranchus ocellatus]
MDEGWSSQNIFGTGLPLAVSGRGCYIAQGSRQPAQYGYCPHRRKLQPTMSNICKEIMSRPKIKSKNDVKEGSCFKSRPIPVSSGRESYVPQVTPDRHQATARKMKDTLNIATWNIRTLLQKGKLENIKQEMERMKLNILGLSEVRWKGAGKITSGGHEIIYSGGTESDKGVGIIVDQTDPLIIMGDFNAKVGTEKVDDIVGNHGLGIRNEREASESQKGSSKRSVDDVGSRSMNLGQVNLSEGERGLEE